MLNFSQMQDLVDDTIHEMGAYSESASLAIMMIIAHESKGGTYIKQYPYGGPALGVIQMEGWVHEDVWDNCDNIHKYAEKLSVVRNVKALVYDLRYNIFMARCRLIMDINPFPKTQTEMSRYLKKYWNSDIGRASESSYYNDYHHWKNSAC